MANNVRSLFNSQKLLFDHSKELSQSKDTKIPEHYYQHGWTIIEDIGSAFEAVEFQNDFIKNIDAKKVSLQSIFADRIQLAKADQIPVCDDIVATSFQVLHFDMGHPFIESEDQLFVSHVGIYLPKNAFAVSARTRIVELNGLLRSMGLSTDEVEKRITSYVRTYGDGWKDHNTFRLACFARFIDALSNKYELEKEIDKTVGQWFQNATKLNAQEAYKQELAFYARHGIDLEKIEHQINLKPGQLLIIDNARVIHGRIGKRKAREIYNFMFGIESIGAHDINALRKYVCRLVT